MSAEPISIEVAAEPDQSAERKVALDSWVDTGGIAWSAPFGSAVDRTFSHSHGSVATRPTPASLIEGCDRFADCKLASACARQPSTLDLLKAISFQVSSGTFIIAYLKKNTAVVLDARTRLDCFRSKQLLEDLAPRVLGLVERR